MKWKCKWGWHWKWKWNIGVTDDKEGETGEKVKEKMMKD